MSSPITTTAISSGDRLGLTLFLAVVVHGLVILGVSFHSERRAVPNPPVLDVVLVQTRSEEKPLESERIAQVHQQASGEDRPETKRQPGAPVTSTLPLPTQGEAPVLARPLPPTPRPAAAPRPVAPAPASEAQRDEPEVSPTLLAALSEPEEIPMPALPPTPVLTQKKPSPAQAPASEAREATPREYVVATAPLPSTPAPRPAAARSDTHSDRQPAPPADPAAEPKAGDPGMSAAQIIERSLEIARLTSEYAERENRYARRPRIHYVDALSARGTVEASYIDAWVRKVERIGNLNYPDEARRRQLAGRLILNVLVNHDGRVLRVEIGSSSGERVLDDAATRIVELASPFAAFPQDMRGKYDQLMITRTWVFQADSIVTR
ncbi:MAG: TonB family protein [Chromatiales bacterium]|nr:TonB family protein [Chromatiales bacterium]